MIITHDPNKPSMNLSFTGDTVLSESKRLQWAVWNEEKNSWMHKWCVEDMDGPGDFFEKENKRQNGIFILYKAAKNPGQARTSDIYPNFQVECDNYVGNYFSAHPDWEEGYIDPMFRPGGFGAPYGAEVDNDKHNLSHQKWRIVYDGAPFFYIGFTNLVDLNKTVEYSSDTSRYVQETEKYEVSTDLEDLFVSQHPFYAARTLGELFKLIMDWDICYNDFNNRENIAILCHNVMKTIGMPQDIYDELYNSLPDTCISKYIKGIENFDQYGDRVATPISAVEWFKEKYWDLQHKTPGHFNISDINEFYYRKRSLFIK